MQFLDSNHSGTLEVTSFDGKSEVKMVKNSLNRLYLKSFSSFTLLRISFIPLFFLSRFYKVGDGYHFGGSFPFGKLNKGNFSDSFGRPNGLSRISLVDSSTMTSINAKPNTFNTMVKARIVASRVIDEKII
jgi:hypothetical protein